MFFLMYLLLLSCFRLKISFGLSESQRAISLELSKAFGINRCVFVQEKKNVALDFKEFSYGNVFTSFMSYEELIQYIFNPNFVYDHGLLFILKGENIYEIKDFLETFQELEIMYRMMNHYTWIAFVEDGQSIRTEMIVPFDCEFIIVQKNNRNDYELTEIYEIENRTFFLDFGMWSQERGLRIVNESFYSRRRDLNQSEILVFFHHNFYGIEEESPTDRAALEMLREIAVVMNFQFDRSTYSDENNFLDDKWQFRNFIFGFASYLTAEDYHYTEFIYPIFKININWYIKQPETKLRTDFYLQPFDRNFWLAVIFLTTIGSIIVVFMQNFVPENEQRTMLDNAFLGLEYLCNQSGNDAVTNFSMRIASFSMRLIYIIVLMLFGAVVTSYLTASVPEIPFDDLQSFLRNDKFKLGLLDDHRFKPFTMDQYNMTGDFLIKFMDEKDLFNHICSENLVFADGGYKIDETNITCDLYQLEKPLGQIFITLLTSTDNTLRKMLNYNVLRFYENGLQIRRQRKLQKRREQIEEDQFQPIQFDQMRQVLSVNLIGVALSATLLIGELLTKNFSNCRYYLFRNSGREMK